eukprot:TRINITY_DN1324_c1_g2_i1.p1 TRINITY_DN1324_c1_g2~~TRINITY_DN1324_c1_g2_i1.p1  ORF type:complete len:744 (+),score=103.01 TRINITY_DN1324_c1_g2_i1:95-2233(+)
MWGYDGLEGLEMEEEAELMQTAGPAAAAGESTGCAPPHVISPQPAPSRCDTPIPFSSVPPCPSSAAAGTHDPYFAHPTAPPVYESAPASVTAQLRPMQPAPPLCGLCGGPGPLAQSSGGGSYCGVCWHRYPGPCVPIGGQPRLPPQYAAALWAAPEGKPPAPHPLTFYGIGQKIELQGGKVEHGRFEHLLCPRRCGVCRECRPIYDSIPPVDAYRGIPFRIYRPAARPVPAVPRAPLAAVPGKQSLPAPRAPAHAAPAVTALSGPGGRSTAAPTPQREQGPQAELRRLFSQLAQQEEAVAATCARIAALRRAPAATVPQSNLAAGGGHSTPAAPSPLGRERSGGPDQAEAVGGPDPAELVGGPGPADAGAVGGTEGGADMGGPGPADAVGSSDTPDAGAASGSSAAAALPAAPRAPLGIASGAPPGDSSPAPPPAEARPRAAEAPAPPQEDVPAATELPPPVPAEHGAGWQPPQLEQSRPAPSLEELGRAAGGEHGLRDARTQPPEGPASAVSSPPCGWAPEGPPPSAPQQPVPSSGTRAVEPHAPPAEVTAASAVAEGTAAPEGRLSATRCFPEDSQQQQQLPSPVRSYRVGSSGAAAVCPGGTSSSAGDLLHVTSYICVTRWEQRYRKMLEAEMSSRWADWRARQAELREVSQRDHLRQLVLLVDQLVAAPPKCSECPPPPPGPGWGADGGGRRKPEGLPPHLLERPRTK